jgi:hypothetical protein
MADELLVGCWVIMDEGVREREIVEFRRGEVTPE